MTRRPLELSYLPFYWLNSVPGGSNPFGFQLPSNLSWRSAIICPWLMKTASPPPAASGLEWAHPLVRDWFVSRFGSPTEPQQEGWPHILAGKSTLISAPTGSG